MRFPFLSKRGQIRGLDFSLALIIFSLTMIQILILTNTFIDGNRSFITLEEREAGADGLGNNIVSSTGLSGTSTNWANSATAQLQSNNWNFGISNGNGINPFKLGRLSNWSITGWELDYNTVKTALNTTDDFKIEVVSTLDITIETINDNGNNVILVNGSITKLNKPLTNAEITGFAVNSTQDIAQGYDLSSVSGTFNLSIAYVATLSANDYYTIVILAEHGSTASDTAITSYTRGTPTIPGNIARLSLFNSTNLSVNDPYAINVTSELDPGTLTANVIALYPGSTAGQQNFTVSTLSTNLDGFWTSDVRSPQNGNMVFVVQGFDGGGLDSIGYLNFPVTLDDEISNSVGPANEPRQSSSTALISILVRGLVLEFLLTFWG